MEFRRKEMNGMTETMTDPETRWFTDTRMRILVSEPDFSQVEAEALRGNMPPLHVHHDEDEIFYVLDGRMVLFVDAERVELGQGAARLAPRGVPHAYRVESERARWLVSSNSGGFAGFIGETSVPAETDGFAPAGSMIEPAMLSEAAARWGIEILGPPGALPV
jgi:mannose-6-phosphate isomerase-like protein (cupin superfamily)